MAAGFRGQISTVLREPLVPSCCDMRGDGGAVGNAVKPQEPKRHSSDAKDVKLRNGLRSPNTMAQAWHPSNSGG